MGLDIADAIDRDGFAVVAGVLPGEDVAALTAAVEALQAGATDSALDRGGRVYASRDLLRDIPGARGLAESSSVRALVEPVLGPGAFVVRGLLFDKTSATNWMVPWHQDLTIAVKARRDISGFGPWTFKAGMPHVRPPIEVLERMLTVRLHLDESGPANGPLRVVPGSHRGGRLSATAICDWLERVGPVTCLVPRGGALVMRPMILHASASSEGSGHRRGLHLEFAANPLPQGLEWLETPQFRSELSRMKLIRAKGVAR